MESRAHALAAGIFVIVLGLCGVAAVWWIGGQGEQTRGYFLVSTKSISGLNPQAQVRYRGIRAGKVQSIDLDPRDNRSILVRIDLDSDIPVTRGTSAQLAFQGVTGLAYVLLDDSGEDPTPISAPPGQLPRIPLKAQPMDTLVEQAGSAVRQLSEAANRANRMLADRNIDNLSRALDNAASGTEGLKDLPRVMAQLHQVLSDENVQRMNRVLAQTEAAAGEVAPLAAQLKHLVASMEGLSRRLDQVTSDVGGELANQTLPDMAATARELQRNSRQLQQLLEQVERTPQSLLFGRPPATPGPGEAGFSGKH